MQNICSDFEQIVEQIVLWLVSFNLEWIVVLIAPEVQTFAVIPVNEAAV